MKSNQTAAVDEQKLLQRIKVDKQAFLVVYDQHFSQIYNYIFYRTFNQADAEELTSQTFLAALENIDRYEYRNIPILVWLYKIAANEVVDFYRRKRATLECEWKETDSLRDSESSPETVYLHKSEKEQLSSYLQTLAPRQQEALILRYRHDLSYKEISEIMEKTEGAIKQLLHRGLKNLRERMVDHE
ncbi:MAG: RNA polymerase sigma factor [Peptococcia bacterium]|jgi:RNA polymerase sigma-70 factor (ECF subfamily)